MELEVIRHTAIDLANAHFNEHKPHDVKGLFSHESAQMQFELRHN